jgi:phospholipase/lecithinase/hemolysin
MLFVMPHPSSLREFTHSMMTRLPILVLLVAATISAQTAPNPHPYTALYVFGDSYSDTGAGFPYADGPTAVAYLAQRLAIPFTYFGDPNSKGKGLNFAVSAGKTGSDPGTRMGPSNALFRLGMKNQVEEFAALLNSGAVKFDPATTMFFLAGGLNDRGTAIGYTRTNEEDEIDTLYALGARRFMVALLPTQIPAFATAGLQLNPEIARIPDEERDRHPGIRIALSNWGSFFDEVITQPAKYGLTDTTTPCAPRATSHPDACSSPATHFYFYEAHPSTAAHKAVGDMLYQEALTKSP